MTFRDVFEARGITYWLNRRVPCLGGHFGALFRWLGGLVSSVAVGRRGISIGLIWSGGCSSGASLCTIVSSLRTSN